MITVVKVVRLKKLMFRVVHLDGEQMIWAETIL